jgi:hypothetical protein
VKSTELQRGDTVTFPKGKEFGGERNPWSHEIQTVTPEWIYTRFTPGDREGKMSHANMMTILGNPESVVIRDGKWVKPEVLS